MQNRIFLFFQFGGNVTLGIGQGLLADIAVLFLHLRHRTFGHFNIITENPVIPDFQRLDSSPFPFIVFLLKDPVFPILLGAAVFVQLFAEAFRKHPAFFHRHRWVFHKRPVQQLSQRQAAVDILIFLKYWSVLKQSEDIRNLTERFLQALAVNRIRRAVGNPGDQPFHIINLIQLILKILTNQIVFH